MEEDELNITPEELAEQLRRSLNYLLAEGVIVELPDGRFHLKTQEEISAELEKIKNEGV